MPSVSTGQDKHLEVEFFDRHGAAVDEYDVFSEFTSQRLTEICLEKCGLSGAERILDLGCGSGVFSGRLAKAGLRVTGVDISPKLIEIARERQPGVEFAVGDAEALTYEDSSFDAVFLGGVIHHFPDPEPLSREVARVTKPGGSFFAFDPNRRNPITFLYRDRSSPFYSSVGVTPNERPVVARDVVRIFRNCAFEVNVDYMSVQYTYVASGKLRWLLPAYNVIEKGLFSPSVLKSFRAFLLTWGRKQSLSRA